MAYDVARRTGAWEIRESHRTQARRLLVQALSNDETQPTDNAQTAAAWITASPERRGETLRDLLLLVDYLPRHMQRDHIRFPRIASRPVAAR